MRPGLSSWLGRLAQSNGRANLQGWKDAYQGLEHPGANIDAEPNGLDALQRSPDLQVCDCLSPKLFFTHLRGSKCTTGKPFAMKDIIRGLVCQELGALWRADPSPLPTLSCCAFEPHPCCYTPHDVAFSMFGNCVSRSQTVAHNTSDRPNHTLACALSN